MSQVNRLSNGGRLDRSKKLTFTFNGQTYTGYEATPWLRHCWPTAST